MFIVYMHFSASTVLGPINVLMHLLLFWDPVSCLTTSDENN